MTTTSPISPHTYWQLVPAPSLATQRRLASVYDDGPSSPQHYVDHAWASLARHLAHAYRTLTARVPHHVSGHDPHPDYASLMREVQQDGQCTTWATSAGDNPHPVWSDEMNDRFRYVHDVVHALHGVDFSAAGEEANYRIMSALTPPGSPARSALACETRAQDAYMRVHGHYRAQRCVLMPIDLT